ncbi:MAG: DUF996 domain-containing protein [Nitrososphaerota archaeon]|jgi:uncharacterized membrane protein|nr:DUF996 domain-containing protein [Nitrososphaerota archaeon]
MNLGTSKTLGRIGAIIVLISPVASIIFSYALMMLGITIAPNIILLTGLILMLAGLYGLSEHYHEPGIFKSALIGGIIVIISLVLAPLILYFVLLPSLVPLVHQVFPGWDGNWASLQGITPDASHLTSDSINIAIVFQFLANLIIVVVITWITTIIATFLIRRSLKQLSEKSNVGLFGTAGTLLLIGAFLTIVLIGIILIWAAVLLLAIALFQIKHQAPNTCHCNPYQPDSTAHINV